MLLLKVDGNRFCDGDDYSEDILIESTSFDISLSTSTESVSGFVIAFAPGMYPFGYFITVCLTMTQWY